MPKEDTERQADYVARQHSKGLAKTCVWVPEGKQPQVHDFAEDLRKKHNTKSNKK